MGAVECFWKNGEIINRIATAATAVHGQAVECERPIGFQRYGDILATRGGEQASFNRNLGKTGVVVANIICN